MRSEAIAFISITLAVIGLILMLVAALSRRADEMLAALVALAVAFGILFIADRKARQEMEPVKLERSRPNASYVDDLDPKWFPIFKSEVQR
jgi:hypothetical protein